MQFLMKGKDFFKTQQRYIYIYIYIYIWKQIKVLWKLSFATLCSQVNESCKACEESCKACEESYKAPCKNTSKPPFFRKAFLLFWNSLLGYSKIKRKASEANANFCVFESQCPKIMILSKALKDKLSSIPSEVISLLMPSLEKRGREQKKPPLLSLWAFVRPPIIVTLWGARGAPLEALTLSDWWCAHV